MSFEENKKSAWNYTINVEQMYGGTYAGRRIIGRDTDVRGGVYYGLYKGEAIVVDPEKYPEEYDRYYGLAAERAMTNGKIDRSKVLRAVFDTVQSEMAYSQEGVDRIVGGQNGVKTELSMFMYEGVGVCRHQALACAAVLERFKDEGVIRGKISVDRNMVAEDDKRDGHAWVRYTSKDGVVMILDVAQNYFGLLKNINPRKQWDYLRPGEKIVSENAGRLILKSF